MLDRRRFLSVLGQGAFGAWCLQALPAWGEDVAQRPPNVVIFLADDLAWSDLGCYGNRHHHTPRINMLAREGVRFTHAYAASAVCSPTRASFLTGQYPARLGFTHIAHHQVPEDTPLQEPVVRNYLAADSPTFAQLLPAYNSALIGKWHLGGFYEAPEGSEDPRNYGFDTAIGASHIGQPPDYFSPWQRTVAGTTYRMPLEPGEEGEYLTDRLTREAQRFVEQQGDEPFCLFMSYYLPHTSIGARLQAEEAMIKVNQSAPNPVYAAMVQHLDRSVGRILGTLNSLGLAENTLVIFASDNGGFGKVTSNAPLRGAKRSPYEGGTRVPLIVRWPGVTRAGHVEATPVTTTDLTATILDAGGSEARVPDGVSLRGLLQGSAPLEREALYWHFPHYSVGYEPYSAVRAGDYKLIEFLESGRVELYDLDRDPAESRDLSQAEPDRVAALRTLLEAWRISVDAKLPQRR